MNHLQELVLKESYGYVQRQRVNEDKLMQWNKNSTVTPEEELISPCNPRDKEKEA